MRLFIEARLVDGDTDTVEEGDGVLAVVVRPDRSLADLGLTLAEGRSLLAKVGDSFALPPGGRHAQGRWLHS